MCNFHEPNLVTFYLCMYLILNEEHFTSYLQYKHSGMFANRKYEKLSYPKKSENVQPHFLVTLLEMQPHDIVIQLFKCDPIQWHILISLLLLQGRTPPLPGDYLPK